MRQLKFEWLRLEPDQGLFRLPSPSVGDIFLDLEGDPFVGEGGLEYLFGVVTTNEDGKLIYQSRWALDRAEERAAFEWFVDFTFERMTRFPDLHIYHFASYEPGAVKRLMLRYATREEEVDRLLRGEVFIDLHSVTKQSVRASIEQYSLKEMERFCDYRRSVPLPEANQARHFIEHQLELSPTPTLTDQACRIVEGYNEDDCRATERLRHWLEPPRLSTGESLSIGPDETVVQAACRAVSTLDNSVRPIQGPPGAGKTFTGARMICHLVNQGKKVGVTAVSHKVIRNLLDKVMDAASEMNVAGVNCAHRKESTDPDNRPVREIGTNEEALQSLQSGAVNVLGGTPWLWCKEQFRDSVHILFVDEAGQMSLANVLACAPAGKNLVLLGDPQQLEQPQQGSHPEGSDISALAHLLDNRKTISEAQGLFLAETWRLHPAICSFTSELFYEGRLVSLSGLERQNIKAPAPFFGAG